MEIARGSLQSGGTEAVWRGEDIPSLDQWKEYRKTQTIRAAQMPVAFKVRTLEGWVEGQPGDWLAMGVSGELYPIADSVFKETYEEVEE